MTYRSAVTVILVLLFISINAVAGTIEDGRLWLTYAADVNLDEQWKISLQLQPYWRDEAHTFDQITHRSGIYYKLDTHLALGAGYAYAFGRTVDGQNTHEDRLWEDFVYQWDDVMRKRWSLRTRLEHRRFEHRDEISHGIRQQVKLNFPMTTRWGLVVSDEVYFNLSRSAGRPEGFDQNRLFFGFSAKLNPDIGLEFGYMNQYSHKIVDDTDNHILAVNMTQTFDW